MQELHWDNLIVSNDFKRTVEVNQIHNIVDSFISLHILLILFYYLFPFHSHLYLYIYILLCYVSLFYCFFLFIFFVFLFFCTFHWTDLSWLTFHYWLYPVWLCMWQIINNLEPCVWSCWTEKSSRQFTVFLMPWNEAVTSHQWPA